MVIAGVQHGNDDFGWRPALGGSGGPNWGMIGWDGARSGIALGRGGRLPPDHAHYYSWALVSDDQIAAA